MALIGTWTQHLYRNLGRPGALAFLALCLLLSAALTWTWHLRREVAVLGPEMVRAEARQQQVDHAKGPRAGTETTLKLVWPSRDEVNEQIFRLQSLAAAERVVLAEVKYVFSPAESPFAGQVRVRVKTTSAYVPVRAFLRSAQLALPALALSRVSFTRQHVADVELDTTLEFVLYYRDAQP